MCDGFLTSNRNFIPVRAVLRRPHKGGYQVRVLSIENVILMVLNMLTKDRIPAMEES